MLFRSPIMTDKEKTNEVNSIIAGLREKYSLEDIKSILIAARFKVINLMRCVDCLPEKTDDPPIDESDLPF